MWRFLGYLLLAGLVIYIIKLALIVGLIVVTVAGLIFRPKQTIGMLACFGFLALLSAFPIPTLSGLGLLLVIGAILRAKEKKAEQAIADDVATSLPAPDDSA